MRIRRVGRFIDFCYGHRIPGHSGKCKNLHGHNARVEIVCEGPLDELGMVVDFAEIKSRLSDAPHVRLSEAPDWLEAAPIRESGFPVALAPDGESFVVHYGGWNERFDNVRDAVNCFLYGLRGECRLRVLSRGTTPYKWILEHRRDGHWVAESSTSRWLFPFWRGVRETLLSNRLDPA